MTSHRIDIYGGRLHIAKTAEQMNRLRQRFDLVDPESIGAAYLTIDTHANNAVHLTVWVDAAKLDTAALVDTIAHESFHAAAQLLDHIGQRTTQHDSETLAYLCGWIAGKVWAA